MQLMCVCVRACVCAGEREIDRERERERERACSVVSLLPPLLHVCMYATYVRVCVCASVRVCVCMRACWVGLFC